MSAPDYTSHFVNWASDQFRNESIFPTLEGTKFDWSSRRGVISSVCCSTKALLWMNNKHWRSLHVSLFNIIAVPFPANFKEITSQIFKRMFRIFAHIYISHIDRIRELDVEAHLNSSFKHFYFFVKEHHLVNMQDMAPLDNVIERIERKAKVEKEQQWDAFVLPILYSVLSYYQSDSTKNCLSLVLLIE